MRRDSQISLPPADACNAYPRVTGQGLKFLICLYNLLYLFFFNLFSAVIKLAFLWFIAGVVFIGLLVEPISENILVEKAIFGAITIVAGIIYWAVLQVEYFLNRKWWAVGFLAFVGIARVGNFNEILSLEFSSTSIRRRVTTRCRNPDNSENVRGLTKKNPCSSLRVYS